MIPQSILSFFHAGKSLPFRSMTYFNFLLEATLAGSVLILVVLVLRRVFRRQIGSRLVYLAWALVAIRLLLPVAIPNPLMDELRPTYSTDTGARPVADQVRVRYHDALADLSYQFSSGPDGTVTQLQRGLSDLTLEVATYTAYGWLGKAYLLLYGVGGLMVAAVFGARHIRFRGRLKRNAVGPLEGEQLALYRELCQRLGVKPLPVIYVDPLPSPCLVGVLKPVIALPLTLPPQSLKETLLHELYHHKAKDPWWVLLRCVCCAVHWFNPLVWLAQRFVKMDCELACDGRVAAGLNPEERLHYANTLIITAKQAYAPHAGVLATGMTMTGKRLKWRVNAILRMKAVRRVAAGLVAALLVLLTVAAFSTAESIQQTKRLTTDSSAFPFGESDIYPAPAAPAGSVALSPLGSMAEAEAQAKRYLLALYPQDREAIETEYRFRVESYNESTWQITVWPPEGGDTPVYSLELKTSGRLVSVEKTELQLFTGRDGRINTPSVLPANLKGVLLEYGRQLSAAVLQSAPIDQVVIHTDMENARGRYVDCDLRNTGGGSPQIGLMTVQIAPAFQFIGLSSPVGDGDPQENPPIQQETQALAYSKDASLRFDAVFWGQTGSMYALSPEAALTVQQAFDIAVEAMLERSGLSREAFLALPLQYGYYDKSNFEGEFSVWRFVWQVEPGGPMDRYWVDFSDMPAPPAVNISKPGEGLG